jgi:opacity protein-like surface antigen
MRYSQMGDVGTMRFAILTIAVSVLLGSSALAQDETPRVQAFGGFSLFHENNGQPNAANLGVFLNAPGNALQAATNFKGWNAEAQYNADRWIGIAVDFGGRYGGPFTATSVSKVSGLPDATSYSVLAGPVISYRTKSKATPFAHALLGVDRTTLKASTIMGLPSPFSTTATTYTDVAFALGIGVDYKISHRFSLRLGQLDYYRTTLNLNKFYQSAFGPGLFEGNATREGNLRFSTGIVIQF